MQISKLDRYRGAMLGTLVGDAAGAPYENKRRAEIHTDLEHRGGLKLFDYVDPWKGKRQMYKGQPTDDSELAAALAQSIVASHGLDECDAYVRFRDFIHGNSPEGRRSILTNGPAYGSGGILRAALRSATYEESLAVFERGEVPVIPTNGSLMRCISVPLGYCNDIHLSINAARRQSCITHVHNTAQAACMAYTVLVSHILDGETPVSAWDFTRSLFSRDPCTGHPGLKDILSVEVSEPSEDDIWPHSGAALISFRVALWASLTACDFRNGITKSIAVGGDTDTYGAIAGGILGARFGVEGIPCEWRDVLIGREIMWDLADGLYVFSGD